jgi:hypothetical protein
MSSEHNDPSRYDGTEDADPAMLVGALGDERVGLRQERDAQPADDEEDAVAGEGSPTTPPPAELNRTSQREPGSGKIAVLIAVPEDTQDADPAILVGALGDERTGLDEERDAERADRDGTAR